MKLETLYVLLIRFEKRAFSMISEISNSQFIYTHTLKDFKILDT